MSSLVIFFVATIAVTLPVHIVNSKPIRSLNDIILEYLHHPQNQGVLNRKDRRHETSDDSDSDSDSLDLSEPSDSQYVFDDLSRAGRLTRENVIDLIQKAFRNKKKRTYYVDALNSGKENNANQIDVFEDKYVQTILEQLLSKGIVKMAPKKTAPGNHPKKGLELNTLLPFKINDDGNDDVTGLEDYSKIYIMLNPSALPKNSKKKYVNELVSKMISAYAETAKSDLQDNSNLPSYKGFLIRDELQSRRARRESKEIYAPKDSIEDDYKQKRSRNDRGGGGGGGRTAIPYIRHRGDIYERDN